MSDIADVFGGSVDAASVPDVSFDPVPAGQYLCHVEKAEVKKTKAGNGAYVNVEMSVHGDAYDGRRIFDKITIANPNEKAVAIGLSQLASLARAVGEGVLSDSAQLVGKYVLVKVAVKKDDVYGDQNVVRKYDPPANPVVDRAPAPASQQPPAAQNWSPTADAKPPWLR